MSKKSNKKPNYNDGTTINTRAYSWDLVIYEIEKSYLDEKLKELIGAGVVTHYSYIQHDKDMEHDTINVVAVDKDGNTIIDKDGNEKTLIKELDTLHAKPFHTHLLITFNQKVSVKVIKNRLLQYTIHNTFGQPIKDKRGAYRYLTHKDNPEKYQYNDSDIVNYDDYFSKYDIKLDLSQSPEYQEINQMIDDYTQLTYRQQACKYGRDYIKNFKSYAYFFDMVIEQEKKNKPI